MQQGTAKETMLGTYVKYNVNQETDLMIGAYYRLKDANCSFGRCRLEKFTDWIEL
jgi:hypothetical protein